MDETARRRTVITAQVLALVLVLAGVLWGADVLARAGARSLVADAVQERTGVVEPPEVQIHGALFLPQVVRGVYDRVDVRVSGVESGPLRLQEVDAELRDVHLPLHDVLVRDVRRIVVESTVQRASLTYEDLDRYLEVTGRPLTVAPGQGGEVTLTGALEVLGQDVRASVDASLAARDGELEISPTQLRTGSDGLDRASQLLLQQRLTFVVPLQSLPFGVEVTGVDVDERRLLVRARGRGVVLEP